GSARNDPPASLNVAVTGQGRQNIGCLEAARELAERGWRGDAVLPAHPADAGVGERAAAGGQVPVGVESLGELVELRLPA
ncbi:MAG: hypothetical protein ACYC0H_23020, partial [Solirubrobacteraceae bacterium]